MPNIPFKVETLEWQKAMRQYLVASKKTIPDCLNHQAKNFCIQSLKYAKKANTSSIKRLDKKDRLIWWTVWQMVKNGAKTNKKELFAIVKKKVIDRIRGIGFLRKFFIGMQNAITGEITKDYSGLKPYYKRPTPENRQCELGISYDYKKRKEKTALGLQNILTPIVQKGLDATIIDMENYVARKLGNEVKQISK